MKKDQGKMETTEQGAKRESNKGRGRFDLLPYEALEAWAIWSEEGAEKYGERNWENGLSVKDCINRLVRHACKAANGWTDEDHLAACMWNAAGAITMIARRPDCNDQVWKNSESVTTLYADNEAFTSIKNSDEYQSESKPDWVKANPSISDVQEDRVYLKTLKDFCMNKIDEKKKNNKIKGIPIEDFLASEALKKEARANDSEILNAIKEKEKEYEKKLLGLLRSVSCLGVEDRLFIRKTIDNGEIDLEAISKLLESMRF